MELFVRPSKNWKSDIQIQIKVKDTPRIMHKAGSGWGIKIQIVHVNVYQGSDEGRKDAI